MLGVGTGDAERSLRRGASASLELSVAPGTLSACPTRSDGILGPGVRALPRLLGEPACTRLTQGQALVHSSVRLPKAEEKPHVRVAAGD